MSPIRLGAVLMFAVSVALSAQQTQQPPAIAVRAARMLDVVSGQMLRNATVVVQGDRISAVNQASVPAGAQVIDLGDVTLLPGFIDAHTHLSGEIGPNTFIEPVTQTEVDAAFKAA